MIIDKRQQVSSQQAIPDGTAVASADIIDLGVRRLIAPGEPLWWVLVSRVSPGGTTPTLDFKVQTATDAAFSSPVDLYAHPQLAAAAFVAGTRIVVPMPWSEAIQRYLRLLYDLGGTSPTWTADAWLTNQDPTSWTAFADAI